MTYAKIENNQITKVGARPVWKEDDGQIASDEVLRAGGYLLDEKNKVVLDDEGNKVLASGEISYRPVIYNQSEHNPLLQRASQLPQDEWIIEPERVVVTYTIHEIPIDQIRESKLQEATDMRWSVMTGGVTLPNGIRIGTGIDDQNRITSVVANAQLAGLADADSVDFKAASGWVSITIAEVKAIAGAIGQFVQACYTAERSHHDAIEALETREEIAAYDTSAGWPNELTSEN